MSRAGRYLVHAVAGEAPKLNVDTTGPPTLPHPSNLLVNSLLIGACITCLASNLRLIHLPIRRVSLVLAFSDISNSVLLRSQTLLPLQDLFRHLSGLPTTIPSSLVQTSHTEYRKRSLPVSHRDTTRGTLDCRLMAADEELC